MRKKFLKRIKNIGWVRKFFYWLVHTATSSWFYKIWYRKIIEDKLRNFKLSDLSVSVESYNFCNARCLMCPYQKMTRPKIKMSMSLFKEVINDCSRVGIKSLNLSFYNEPFLDDLIFERIKYAKSKGIKVSLFSNGSILNSHLSNQSFESGLDEVNFSFDGFFKETYEKIRVNLNFEETRDNILNFINERNKRGLSKPKITMIFVKTNQNLGEIEAFRNFWQNKVEAVRFSRDDNRNKTYNLSKILKKGDTAYPCCRFWNELIIMSDGRVPLCCVDYDGKIILGDFNKQTLKEIWESDIYKRIRELHLSYQADEIGLCKNCLHPYHLNAWNWLY